MFCLEKDRKEYLNNRETMRVLVSKRKILLSKKYKDATLIVKVINKLKIVKIDSKIQRLEDRNNDLFHKMFKVYERNKQNLIKRENNEKC